MNGSSVKLVFVRLVVCVLLLCMLKKFYRIRWIMLSSFMMGFFIELVDVIVDLDGI